MSEILVSAKAVSKTYAMGRRSLKVLRELSISVAVGEFVALRGASGAGKSTLLHLLGGLDTPDTGEIWFAGQDLAKFSASELAALRRTRVGFVFQAFHLMPELDALENVCLPARIARLPMAEAAARGRDLLARVGLKDRMEHRPSELSGGERQRVALARALVNQPDLILADEPTGNLDSRTGGEIIDLLCTIVAERKTTLIIATHDASVAARAPKVVQLVDGQIAGEAKPDEPNVTT
ncbi:MAG: ABC transporter ATP-binding protein [Akkermansiaceae bacterium]|nr:ABC transporter ATP-binding protein [Verrucomicrobiales bacterium]